jgi:hypothetical protein
MQSTLDAIKEEEEEFHSNDLSFHANSVGTKKIFSHSKLRFHADILPNFDYICVQHAEPGQPYGSPVNQGQYIESNTNIEYNGSNANVSGGTQFSGEQYNMPRNSGMPQVPQEFSSSDPERFEPV